MINQFLTDVPACASQQGTWCAEVWSATHIPWLATSANWLVAKPLKIALVLAVAALARFLTHRVIDRISQGNGAMPSVLRPLRERAPQALMPLLSERRTQRARTIGSVLKSIVSITVWGIALISILGDLGFNLAPILASAGIVGLAIGFGAQNLVKDFISGVFMLLEDQYGVGDVVDLGQASGRVEAVGLRTTSIRDDAGTLWYVRNGEVQRVGNSSQGYSIAVIDVPIGYQNDLNQALELLSKVAKDATSTAPVSEDVLEEPEVLGVQSITNENMTLRLTIKVRPGRHGATQRALRREILAAFDNAGIEPPLTRADPDKG